MKTGIFLLLNLTPMLLQHLLIIGIIFSVVKILELFTYALVPDFFRKNDGLNLIRMCSEALIIIHVLILSIYLWKTNNEQNIIDYCKNS